MPLRCPGGSDDEDSGREVIAAHVLAEFARQHVRPPSFRPGIASLVHNRFVGVFVPSNGRRSHDDIQVQCGAAAEREDRVSQHRSVVLLGVPMAVVLARADFPGRSVLRALVLLPLVLPPVVAGIALLYTFGRMGLLGVHLETLGLRIAFSTTAVVLAQSFVSLPFLVVSLEGALRTAGTQYENIAATLGARPTMVLRTVTLPLVTPGLKSGAVLAFARSLGEFGATLTFAGSLQGVTRTLPLDIYLQRETDPHGAVALSLLLIVVAILIVVASATRKVAAPL